MLNDLFSRAICLSYRTGHFSRRAARICLRGRRSIGRFRMLWEYDGGDFVVEKRNVCACVVPRSARLT